MNILEALDHPDVFARAIRDPSTWRAWRVFLCALFGLPMSGDDLDLFKRCTGRAVAPAAAFTEAVMICGRRAGKSFTMALVAVFLACFRSYVEYLGPGERATIMVIAADRRQARVVMRYVRGLLQIPSLARLLEREAAESFDLNNRVTIEVATANYKTVRGYTLAALIADECAHWATDEGSASPDAEIIAACRPAMATIPGAVLLIASSPYARRGVLWDSFKRSFGKDDAPVLVWKADTRTMNPTVPQSVIDEAYERDPASAAAEFGAEFRADIEAFISRDVVEAAVESGVVERGPIDGVRYVAFSDPSGGSNDAFTLAIAHAEGRVLTLDATRERKPPFSPEAVVAEFCELLKRYHISVVRGDRYAGSWPAEAFSRHGIQYLVADKNRSELYAAVLPEFNSRSVALLDNARVVNQFVGLERRTTRGGRDLIDHAPGQHSHDDLANAVAGALLLAKPNAAAQIPEIGVIHIPAPDGSTPWLGISYTGGSGFGFPW